MSVFSSDISDLAGSEAIRAEREKKGRERTKHAIAVIYLRTSTTQQEYEVNMMTVLHDAECDYTRISRRY